MKKLYDSVLKGLLSSNPLLRVSYDTIKLFECYHNDIFLNNFKLYSARFASIRKKDLLKALPNLH